MDPNYKKLLEKQSYEFCGEHSAVKICAWTKKSLRDEGVCYKEKFYGIVESHRCCQIAPSINFCNMDCIFCWRERNNSAFVKIDEPKKMIDNAIKAQKKLLSGFGGNDKVNLKKLKESSLPKQFAISLSGEPLAYSKLNELIKELKKRGMTSFVVTNGQFPEKLARIEPPTQLYLSLAASDKDTFMKITKPDLSDGWERLMQSVDEMKELGKKTRTTLRITLIKEWNMKTPEKYAKLIEKSGAKYVEVKAYMFVGASRDRLDIKNMPLHSEVKKFAEKICEHCDYKIVDEQKASRVVLLMPE